VDRLHALLLGVIGALLCAWLLVEPECYVPPRRFAGVRAQMAAATPSDPVLYRPLLLLFGDSLTERSMDPDGGWGATLAHHFARKVRAPPRGSWGRTWELGPRRAGQAPARPPDRAAGPNGKLPRQAATAAAAAAGGRTWAWRPAPHAPAPAPAPPPRARRTC
jgi:hypothetical protein